MAIAILSETQLTIIEAARRCSKGKRPTHWQTVRRWMKRGRKVGGKVIRLEACHTGNRVVTSVEALERFFSACTEAAGYQQLPQTVPTIAQREKANRRALQDLRAMGLKV
jgi:hypothetical protein